MPTKEKLDFIISIVASSFFVLLLVVAGVMLFRIYLKRKNRLILEKERMSLEFEQTLLKSKLEIQEQTFTYISQEIHDNIGQILSLVRINLNTLENPNDPGKMELMDELMGKAITDLRNLSHSLDTDLIRNAGWVKAAERLLADMQRSGSFAVSFSSEQNLPPLGNERSIILFRMIQEIINNIIKHAQASQIKFTAINKEDRIIIEIADNGRGFEPDLIAKGAGLQNLVSRSRMINAEMNISTEPGNGTAITISINAVNNDI